MISLLVPSRGRPENVVRLYESVRTHAAPRPPDLSTWEMVIRLDDDDPLAGDYPDYMGIRYIGGPRVVLSETWNECWREARGDVFWHGGDDVVFRTPNWDGLVLGAFPPDGIAFVHGDDLGGKGDKLGTHGFLRREWTDVIGRFVPPYFSSDYNDLWLNEVADAIGRRIFVPELVTEHMHPGFGKAEWDQTHNERVARHWADDVDRIWRETEGERDAWAERLRGALR